MNPFSVRRTGAQWTVDASVFAAAVLSWVFYAVVTADDYSAIPDWFWGIDRTLGAVACGALWWARRYPVAVGVLLVVPGALAVTAGFAVLAGVYRMATLARPRVSTAVALVHIGLALPYHALFPVPEMTWLAWMITIPLVYLLSLSAGLLTRARRLAIEGLRETAARDRAILESRLASLRRDEREQIAREMHDVLAHRISLLSVHAGALEFRTAPGSGGEAMTAPEIHGAAQVIRDNAHLAVTELGEVLAVLRSAGEHDHGDAEEYSRELGRSRPPARLATLAQLAEEATESGQLVELQVDDGVSGALGDAQQRTVYRIVQEGLTNARKHAPRSPVSVAVRMDADAVRVDVSNPVPVGVTTAEIPGTGVGLVGLRERVRIDGGRIFHGVDGGTFSLVGTVPVNR